MGLYYKNVNVTQSRDIFLLQSHSLLIREAITSE